MKRPWTVWIVEMWLDDTRKAGWEPTVGIALDRNLGRERLKQWQRKCPDDRFRLVQYRRVK